MLKLVFYTSTSGKQQQIPHNLWGNQVTNTTCARHVMEVGHEDGPTWIRDNAPPSSHACKQVMQICRPLGYLKRIQNIVSVQAHASRT